MGITDPKGVIEARLCVEGAMPPKTRYARYGDLSIAYQTFGDGEPRSVWTAAGRFAAERHSWRASPHLRRGPENLSPSR